MLISEKFVWASPTRGLRVGQGISSEWPAKVIVGIGPWALKRVRHFQQSRTAFPAIADGRRGPRRLLKRRAYVAHFTR
jgi:hypothetical protein